MHSFLQTIGRWLLSVACLAFATSTSAAEPALELVVQAALVDPTSSMALSQDGRRAVLVSVNGHVNLWDVVSGQVLRSIPVPADNNSGGPTRVATSENCERILVQYPGAGRKVVLWNAETGQRVRDLPCDESRPMAFSRDGRLIVTEVDGLLVVHHAETGQRLKSLPKSEGTRSSVALSADGRRLLEGLSRKNETTGTVMLWDTSSGAVLKSFPEFSGACQAVALNEDGQMAVVATSNKILIWNLAQGGPAKTLEGELGELRSVVVSSDGQRVLAVSSEKAGQSARLWDAQTGRLLQEYVDIEGWFRAISATLSGDGLRLLTLSNDGKSPTVWEAATHEKLQTLQAHLSPQDAVAISGDGSLLVSSGNDQVAISWDTALGRRERTLPGEVSAVSHDGRRVLTKSSPDHVTLWNSATSQKLMTLGEPSQELVSVFLSGDARRVLTNRTRVVRNGGITSSTVDRDGVLWDVTNGQKIWRFEGEGTLSDDGRLMLIRTKFDSPSVSLVDTATGKTVQSFRTEPLGIFEFALSGDGRRVLTVSRKEILLADNTVTLWDASTGRAIKSFKLPQAAKTYRCSLSNDGTRCLLGHENDVTVWDATSGQLVSTIANHLQFLRAVLSRDGRLLLGAAFDGSTRLWDANTGAELCRLFSIDGGKDWLVVSPDGLFDGSIDAAKSVSYRLRGSLEFVALERFQHRYYQPGLLALLMKGERPRAKVDIGKSLPPKVRIVSPSPAELDVQSGTISVRATAETRGEHPITMFRLLLDGRPYQGQNSLVRIADPKPGEASATWRVELEPGRHKLKVLADTAYVQGTSDELEVKHIGGQSNADIELPSLYVLAVGVSKYPGTRKLDYAALDATAIAGAYQQHSRSLFKNVEVKVLTDEQATRNGIFDGTRWLREKMNQKSVGVFFFAGHGEKDPEGSLYFLPVDFEEKNLAGSALDADVVKKQLSGIPGRLTLILDACHSGQIGTGLTRGVGSLTDQLVRDLTAEENGIIVMCSALGTEPAQESHQHRHGVFTVAMLEGLAGQAKKTSDGAVYLTSLDAYVTERVRDLTKGQQHPVTSRPTTVRDFPVSKP